MNENSSSEHDGGQDEALSPEERASLEVRYRNALAEVGRLSHVDDRASGSADRTSREAGRAMWLAEAERLRVLLGEPVADAVRDSLEGRIVDGT
ncbi:MAG: hypothetical protein WD942_09605 [Dehalococcoidia bacterium]